MAVTQTLRYYVVNVPNPDFSGVRRHCHFVNGEFQIAIPRQPDFPSKAEFLEAKTELETLINAFVADGYSVSEQKVVQHPRVSVKANTVIVDDEDEG